MKKFLILAIIALSMLVSVNAIDMPDANMTINESGTYVLSEDILALVNQSGILINASNVVLDGQNHQLIGNTSSEDFYCGIQVSSDGIIENITIKNFVISNWFAGADLTRGSVKNITIMNCEFEDNVFVIGSNAVEQYFYLNTIHENQYVRSNSPLTSPKLVYKYNGTEYTYRLGNYYEGYVGDETEDEGVYSGVYEIYGEFEEFRVYDPYPLIETPENYEVLQILYPEVYDEEIGQIPALIADIFALDSRFENYVITDAPVTTTTTPSSSSRGGGSSYDSDVSDGIQSRLIKSFVSSATVIYGNDIDETYAKQLRERVHAYNDNYAYSGNMIIVGGPTVNKLAKKYNDQFEIPISNDVPGENRGVIQVMTVQDNSGSIIQSYTIVYIAGSDRLGTLAAMEYFKTLDKLPEGPIVIEGTENGPVLVE
ncbi:hypothetical protein [Methanococcus maripaludis]|uniref:S-layer protein outer domain-containing protein n=1 Tax=Methanococcus maripaludis TaxID=39152 RepID=A0A2L1C872_METMI|nr:hypothetical protein [Methanococcus maripaludis]AVB75544.1 hypothetical protein MMJJ_01250 [Methanococcus maripaludis]MBA2863869.1 hypothetical protein [Methanococcus maripaludis]MBB6496125.1 hypothetical protein [Methanococcus maripaludis]